MGVFKLRKAAAALGAAAAAACAAAAPLPAPQAEPRPALWKLADEDTTIYLFGTIHVLPKGLEWRTPALEEAIRKSDALILETSAGSDMAATGKALAKMGISPGLPPLVERVPPEKREALKKLIARSGASGKSLDRLETWAAAMALVAGAMRGVGFEAEIGAERGLEASYRAAGKPIGGLETVEQQFGFFDQLSEASQRAFLADAIESPEEALKQIEAMVKAWAAGDTDAIARTFDDETALSPELRKVLMTDRNAAWAEWLEDRLEEPGTVMVAVGAGHLAGKDSVHTMLERKGLKATRVQ